MNPFNHPFGIHALIYLFTGLKCLYAHDNEYVHPTLTAISYEKWANAATSGVARIDQLDKFPHLTTSRPIGGFDHDKPTDTGWLAQGAIDEDNDPRYCNYFYNPIGPVVKLTNSKNPL